MCARIQFPLYVAGRRVKVVPRYALGFHLDPPPGSVAFAFRISRRECCSLMKIIQISARHSASGFPEPQTSEYAIFSALQGRVSSPNLLARHSKPTFQLAASDWAAQSCGQNICANFVSCNYRNLPKAVGEIPKTEVNTREK
jgi:hypothetical protein